MLRAEHLLRELRDSLDESVLLAKATGSGGWALDFHQELDMVAFGPSDAPWPTRVDLGRRVASFFG